MVEVREHQIRDDTRHESIDERAPVAQWVGFFLAPAVFFAHLQIAYVIVPWACARRGDAWFHVVGVLSVVLSLAGAIVAWRVWQRVGRDEPGEGSGALPRTRFVAVTALGMSTLFTLLLVVQWVAGFFITVCQ
jgi:hypothetical protein